MIKTKRQQKSNSLDNVVENVSFSVRQTDKTSKTGFISPLNLNSERCAIKVSALHH